MLTFGNHPSFRFEADVEYFGDVGNETSAGEDYLIVEGYAEEAVSVAAAHAVTIFIPNGKIVQPISQTWLGKVEMLCALH